MGKQKAKKSKKTKRKTSASSAAATPAASSNSWVDRATSEWLPLHDSNDDKDDKDDDEASCDTKETSSPPSSISPRPCFGLVTWNVLADSYCSPRSHAHLPLVYQRHVFDRIQRQKRIRQVLTRIATNLAPDFLALQEVDAPLEVPKCLKEHGYAGHHTPTDPSGKNGRVDSCTLYYRKDLWQELDVTHVRFDDLSSLSSEEEPTIDNDSASKGKSKAMNGTLQGIQSSYIRKNMALLVRLKHIETNFEVTIAVVHLFWNPEYQDVKLCQAHYVALKTCEFAAGSKVLVVGDTNSQPGSTVHEYFVKGVTNARRVAPWYKVPETSQDQQLQERFSKLDLNGEDNDSKTSYYGLRYLVDYSLNRLCRWLRILGIDCEIETDAEERQRTKEGNNRLFDRAREENRTLITASTRLVLRKGCPPGTYVLDTKGLANLEVSLVHLLLTHGVTVEPKRFLTRCVVCNSHILPVSDKKQIKTIFESHQAPESLLDQNLDVFQCSGCTQGYWYNDQPNSSASRVKNQATHLLELCIHGGVPIGKDLGMFSFVDVEEVNSRANKDKEITKISSQRLAILDWLQQDQLKNPLGALSSAYGQEEETESLPFTNVTHSFVGHLDYIFHDRSLSVQNRMYVPTSYEALNDQDLRNGHLLPSNIWPSDHLALGATFEIPLTKQHKHAIPVEKVHTQQMQAKVPSPTMPTIASVLGVPPNSVPLVLMTRKPPDPLPTRKEFEAFRPLPPVETKEKKTTGTMINIPKPKSLVAAAKDPIPPAPTRRQPPFPRFCVDAPPRLQKTTRPEVISVPKPLSLVTDKEKASLKTITGPRVSMDAPSKSKNTTTRKTINIPKPRSLVAAAKEIKNGPIPPAPTRRQPPFPRFCVDAPPRPQRTTTPKLISVPKPLSLVSNRAKAPVKIKAFPRFCIDAPVRPNTDGSPVIKPKLATTSPGSEAKITGPTTVVGTPSLASILGLPPGSIPSAILQRNQMKNSSTIQVAKSDNIALSPPPVLSPEASPSPSALLPAGQTPAGLCLNGPQDPNALPCPPNALCCVPPIPSLFQMAELRRQARLKREQEAAMKLSSQRST